MSKKPEKETETKGKPQEALAAEAEPEAAQPKTAADRANELRALSDEALLVMSEEADKAAHWLDKAQRAQAELDNTIKRMRRDAQEDLRYANSGIARDLLPVIDNLARAVQSSGTVEALSEGVKLTVKLLNAALAKHGITPIEAKGKPFDPAFHEAVMAANNSELPDNAVAMELEQGWKMHDRVLRAAKVQVNKR